MPVVGRWRDERDLGKKVASYVASLMREPEDADVEWLTRAATKGDADHARWELRYARRALGLIVAQRDALDDKTGSAVARALSDPVARDPSLNAPTLEIAERHFNPTITPYPDRHHSRSPAI